ncbi:MAG: PD-(D/E)XK nuclease family protein [Nanopusillaceae archaeon]
MKEFNFLDILLDNPNPVKKVEEETKTSPPQLAKIDPIENSSESKSNSLITVLGYKTDKLEYRNLLSDLNNLYIRRYIEDLLNPYSSKYISVSTLTECNMKTWLIKTKKISERDIEVDKFFNMLELYGYSGNLLHDKVYKDLNLKSSSELGLDNVTYPTLTTIPYPVCELTLTDENLRLKGRIDIINGTSLIDIKTSLKEKDYYPQLSMYYYLCKHHNINITEVKVWYIMLNKEVVYDINLIEDTIKTYINKLIDLKRSLESNLPPKIRDTDCRYCELEKFCKSRW